MCLASKFTVSMLQEEKLLQNMKTEKNILDQREKEVVLCQQNKNKQQKVIIIYYLPSKTKIALFHHLFVWSVFQFLEDLIAQQRRLDEEVSKCRKEREKEQNRFIAQLQTGKFFSMVKFKVLTVQCVLRIVFDCTYGLVCN